VLAYPGEEIEVVAVDDASTDDTFGVLEATGAKDARLRVLCLPVNQGPGPARNAGLDASVGDYIWFVDADDELPPQAVATVLDQLSQTTVDVLIVDHAAVFSAASVRRRTVDIVGPIDGPTTFARCPKLARVGGSACTKIFRRTLLDRTSIRFPPGTYEDAYFSRALLMAAESIGVLDEVCYRYLQHPQGTVTTTRSSAHFDVFEQYERLFRRIEDAQGALDAVRPELFRVMIDHYLTIFGNRSRLPDDSRLQFFRQMAADYVRWLPAGGYPKPGAVGRVKHRLVRYGAYAPFAALRWAYRLLPRRSPYRRGR
jgi:CDP-glycerol glycerophosphotransferase